MLQAHPSHRVFAFLGGPPSRPTSNFGPRFGGPPPRRTARSAILYDLRHTYASHSAITLGVRPAHPGPSLWATRSRSAWTPTCAGLGSSSARRRRAHWLIGLISSVHRRFRSARRLCRRVERPCKSQSGRRNSNPRPSAWKGKFRGDVTGRLRARLLCKDGSIGHRPCPSCPPNPGSGVYPGCTRLIRIGRGVSGPAAGTVAAARGRGPRTGSAGRSVPRPTPPAPR